MNRYPNETQPELPAYPIEPLDSLMPTPPTQQPIPPTYPTYPTPTQPLTGTPVPAKKKMPTVVKVAMGVFIGCFAFCGFIGLIVGINASNGKVTTQATHTTQAPTAKPAVKAPVPANSKSWQTIATYKGNGTERTSGFTVTAPTWKLVWSCDPNSFYGSVYNLIVDAYHSDGSFADFGAVNTICSPTNKSGSTMENNLSGSFYLDINSEAAYTVQVEVLQ